MEILILDYNINFEEYQFRKSMFYYSSSFQQSFTPINLPYSLYTYYPQTPNFTIIHPQLPLLPPPTIESFYELPSSSSSNTLEVPKNLVCCLQKKQKQQNKNIVDEDKQSFIEKRNIIPNNINHILSFVQRKNKSFTFVQKAIKKYKGENSPFSSKRFYSYQFFIKGKLSIHVNKSTLAALVHHIDFNTSIFSYQQQIFYNKICRIIIDWYLIKIAPLITLHSHRLVQTSKNDHLRAQRNLRRYMERITKQNYIEQASI